MAINYKLKKIVTTWCVGDVQTVRADLTDEQAWPFDWGYVTEIEGEG